MYAGDGGLVVSPTDLVRHLACRHLTQLDLQVAQGLLGRPVTEDEALEILFRRGLDHEQSVLDGFRTQGLVVEEIDCAGSDAGSLTVAEAATVTAMAAGADVVYQATFFDGTWRGHADFLIRNSDRPSAFGSWSYDVADTKLARRLKATAAIQMAVYAERLTVLQGVAPQSLTVIGGNGAHHVVRLRDCDSYTRRATDNFLAELAESPVWTWPEPVSYCAQCRWAQHCADTRRRDDDLSLVHSMRRDHARLLRDAGLTTVAQLAVADPAVLPARIGEPSRIRLAHQARLQVHERQTGTATYDLLPVEPGRGLSLLPAPSAGDVFFDIEGDPFVGEHGLEYLLGLQDADGTFTAYWGHDAAGERAAFEATVDYLMARWATDQGMHVYHYAAYERSRLTSLAARYGTREEEVDRLLRGGRLVDLYAVVRQGLRISKESYSIKQLEAFYLPPEERKSAAVADAGSSIVAYERWLVSRDQTELDAIEEYNALDCRSTQLLRDWLEGRRRDLIATGTEVDRPEHGDGQPSEKVAEATNTVLSTCELLLDGLPVEPVADDAAQAATRLLAFLLDWHRREDRPAWWEYFARRQMTDEELVDDTGSLGALSFTGDTEPIRRSMLYRYTFPPQETKFGPGDDAYDPRTGRRIGEVQDIDVAAGWVTIRRSKDVEDHPPSVIPMPPLDTAAQRGALLDVAAQALTSGVDGAGSYCAARDLLLGRTLRGAALDGGGTVRPNETPAAAVARLALALDGSVLPVQGPPGTGKTYTGARAVLALVAEGKRVGVCATSHRAIGNLLDEIVDASADGNQPRIMQKCADNQACRSSGVEIVSTNNEVSAALTADGIDVVGGTPWLFCRGEFREAFDVIVIDEASQMSLANAVAVATAARNVILLGDPRQLPQPVRGVHPPRADASALGHLLGARDTIAGDQGVFLPTTWRMHPEIAAFVSEASYDGRLHADCTCAAQQVDASGVLTGAGTFWVPVEHTDNSSASPEEAEVVARLLDDLLQGTWTDQHGDTRPLTLDEVLVIAPYNAQLNQLRTRLPEDARIGTVDEFQGQEAAVVLYSLASSSSEDAPRGVEFLLHRNRFNVAVSRARGIAAVVGSPTLLASPVHSIEQLATVNLLCRWAEEARTANPVGLLSGGR